MKKFIKVILMVLMLFTGSLAASADPGDVEENPDAEQAPIDGGLLLLLAAGVAYGAKKHTGKREKHKEEVENFPL